MLRVPAPTFDRSNCRDEELPITATPKSSELRAEIEGVGGVGGVGGVDADSLPPPPPPHPISKNSTVKIAKPEIRLRFIKYLPFWLI